METYVDGSHGGGQPLEASDSTTTYLYHGDTLGSVVALTNASSGGVAASYAYSAYGTPTASARLTSNPFGYTGSAVDPVTGFVFDGARVYDPTTGRFLTPDPLGGGYAYAADNPVACVGLRLRGAVQQAVRESRA